MKIFAKIFCLVLAGVLALMAAGCHGAHEVNEFAIPESFDDQEKFEITFWAKNDTNINQTTIYKNAIESFQTLYPNIHVNLRLYTDYGTIYEDVLTNIATGTTPNVCITYPDHIATYMTGKGTVVPLDNLFADPKYGLGGSELRFDGPTLAEMVPEFLEECKIGEEHYAVPYMRSTEACYINKDMVEALGYEVPDVLTWDFIWEVCEKAMAKGEDGKYLVNGQKALIPFVYKSTDNMMIQMLRQKEAGYSYSTGEILLFNDTTKELLSEIASHAATGAFSTFKISSYPANLLNKGQCIFAVDSTAGATWMGTHAPLSDISEQQIVEFETVVRPVPQFDPENPKMISQGPSICIFNKEDPDEVMASWIFTQFLLTNEVQIGYAETEGYVPVTRKAQQSAEYLDYLNRAGEDNDHYYDVKLAATKLLIDNTENTFITAVFNGSTSVRNAAGELIESTVKAVRRKTDTIDEAYFKKLFDNTVSSYRLDQIAAGGILSRKEMGPLPAGSKALLIGLGVVWVLLGIYWVKEKIKSKNK